MGSSPTSGIHFLNFQIRPDIPQTYNDNGQSDHDDDTHIFQHLQVMNFLIIKLLLINKTNF